MDKNHTIPSNQIFFAKKIFIQISSQFFQYYLMTTKIPLPPPIIFNKDIKKNEEVFFFGCL